MKDRVTHWLVSVPRGSQYPQKIVCKTLKEAKKEAMRQGNAYKYLGLRITIYRGYGYGENTSQEVYAYVD